MTTIVNEERCEAFGLDPKRVASIARRIARAAAEARVMGLTVFGGSGAGSLRCNAAGGGHLAEVADLGFGFDGGDGGDA